MDRIGIFYGSTSGHTRRVAELIRREFVGESVDVHDVSKAGEDDIEQYDMLILGAPTCRTTGRRSSRTWTPLT